jgi:lipoprotein-anchoring transpeptidase ErfK/SrfK
MNKAIALFAATIATAMMFSVPAHAGFFSFGKEKTTTDIKLVSLQTKNTKMGWMQVLADDSTPAKPKKVKANVKTDINHSPIARKLVAFETDIAPGTIVIDNSDRRLYHVISKGLAVEYGIAIGKEGFGWTGTEVVTAKNEWPTWTPPEEMRVREARKGHMLPEKMEGGIDNPLGARAMYLGSTQYRIHGTNQPNSIGKAASSGCFRMANEDVEHLYASVTIGTKVIIRN